MTHPSAAPASHSLVGKVHVDNPETVSPATPSPVVRIFDEAFSLSLDEIHWEPPHRVPPETFWSRVGPWIASATVATYEALGAAGAVVGIIATRLLGIEEGETGDPCPVCESHFCATVHPELPTARPCSGPRVLAQCCVTLETVELTDEGTCPHVNGHLHPLTNERLKGAR